MKQMFHKIALYNELNSPRYRVKFKQINVNCPLGLENRETTPPICYICTHCEQKFAVKSLLNH